MAKKTKSCGGRKSGGRKGGFNDFRGIFAGGVTGGTAL